MKHEISDIGVKMLRYQEQLAHQYRYKPIHRTFFLDVRTEYEDALPDWCNVAGDDISLETVSGTVIANGYTRIVIGDYGSFIEITASRVCALPDVLGC